MNRRLGKLPPKIDPRTLKMAKYVPTTIPVPASVDWTKKVPAWPMFINDQIGDCTCAAAGHMIECWSSLESIEAAVEDQDVLTAYEVVSGYDPITGENDNGAVELDVLNYWRNTGIAGHLIGAYVQINPKHMNHLKLASWLFGGLYIGLALPLTAQDQDVWDVPGYIIHKFSPEGAPGSWGGHAVNIVAYDHKTLTCVTWGGLKKMTWNFFGVYCDEAYGIVSQDWVTQQKPAPNGFDMGELIADLGWVSR